MASKEQDRETRLALVKEDALEPELVGAFSGRRFETGGAANGSGYY